MLDAETTLVPQRKLELPTDKFDHRPLFVNDFITEPILTTRFGALFDGDCMEILPKIADKSIDTVFADPPFNLGKTYGKKTNDRLKDSEYLEWCRAWVAECVRCLKPGGAFYLYNLPKWNMLLGPHLYELGMEFRHWIAINIKSSLPIPGRLYPSHYSLLYYTKGKPKTYRKIRTPIELCRHCRKEVKDYGGHRGAMNPLGVNLTDVWNDIPPVRHWKFKSQKRKANQLSTKLLDRVIEMSTYPGDIVLDPFGGSGTTYAVAESKGRKWVGIELDFADVIAERLESADLFHHKNDDVIDD